MANDNDIYFPDNDDRERLRVNINVRNRAINGGDTREWLHVFGFITNDAAPPADFVPMPKRPEPRRIER